MMKNSQLNSYLFGGNAPYVEELYERYLADPGIFGHPQVEDGYILAQAAGCVGDARCRQPPVSARPITMRWMSLAPS